MKPYCIIGPTIFTELALAVQTKHLFATGLIDDVVIGNEYASSEELTAMTAVNPYQLELEVDFVSGINKVEQEIVITCQHFRRGDITSQVIRSTEVRKKFSQIDNPKHDNDSEFQRGDIVIGNNDFGKYKNELQVVLEPHTDARKNRVGQIKEAELILLDFIRPWTKFRLK